ncbi:hypothetical protein [Puia dinghuensis]|uniref:Uncharacterized protein n=1 Tax=Puia dinghuensis TaxID=1792502 RepID=A0A8J2XQ94_9BACT|nr:hypothetical protein [Puia dinghuensis]GGA83856.1 hypothetical protein GCM10011511_03750 [Puia dinghuensis]
MKSDLVHSIVQMEANILKQLVTEVKETVATEVELPRARKSSFGVTNLWAIRRKSRYAATARRKPRIITGFGY